MRTQSNHLEVLISTETLEVLNGRVKRLFDFCRYVEEKIFCSDEGFFDKVDEKDPETGELEVYKFFLDLYKQAHKASIDLMEYIRKASGKPLTEDFERFMTIATSMPPEQFNTLFEMVALLQTGDKKKARELALSHIKKAKATVKAKTGVKTKAKAKPKSKPKAGAKTKAKSKAKAKAKPEVKVKVNTGAKSKAKFKGRGKRTVPPKSVDNFKLPEDVETMLMPVLKDGVPAPKADNNEPFKDSVYKAPDKKQPDLTPEISTCGACDKEVPPEATSCPHCRADFE